MPERREAFVDDVLLRDELIVWRLDLQQKSVAFELGHDLPENAPDIFVAVTLDGFRKGFLKSHPFKIKQIAESEPQIVWVVDADGLLLKLLFEEFQNEHEGDAVVASGEVEHVPVGGSDPLVIPFRLVDSCAL